MFKSTGSTSRIQDADARGSAHRADSKTVRRMKQRLEIRRGWFSSGRKEGVFTTHDGFKLPGSQNRNKR